MCEHTNEIHQIINSFCQKKNPFTARDVVVELRQHHDLEDGGVYIDHRQVAVEVYKAFQTGKFPTGWIAQPVTKVSLNGLLEESKVTYLVFRYSRYAAQQEQDLLNKTYRS